MKRLQTVHIVAGCVIEKDGKYLLVQEKKPIAYGLWNLPAGRANEGETFQQAARREVLEETGLSVTVGKKIGVFHYDPTLPVLHAFQTESFSGTLKIPEDELLDARWFKLEEIKQLSERNQLRSPWALEAIEKLTVI